MWPVSEKLWDYSRTAAKRVVSKCDVVGLMTAAKRTHGYGQ